VVAPIGLTLLVITGAYLVSGGTDPGFPPQFPPLVYGIASIVTVGVAFAVMDENQWQAAALFRRPGRTELVAGAGATVLGVLVGIGLNRGYSPLVAGTGSVLVFAVVRVFTAGVAGVVNGPCLIAGRKWNLLFCGFLDVVDGTHQCKFTKFSVPGSRSQGDAQ
jgi:hypothetical protein